MRKFDQLTEIKLYGVLIFGLVCIGFSIYQLPVIWASKSSLVPIHGTIRLADLAIKTVTDSRGHKSQISELTFFLNESEKKFQVAENIGSDYINEEYTTILKQLNRARSVTVWIHQDELSEYQPKVFQIDKDEKTSILEFQKIKDSARPLAVVLMVIGISSIGFFIWMKYPDKLRKIFND